MCSPQLVVAGITLATTAAKARAEAKNQEAMLSYENEKTKRVAKEAQKARYADMRALSDRARQMEESAAMELNLEMRAAEEQIAMGSVSAQASGVGELGLADLTTTLGIKAGESAAARSRTLSWEQQQVMRSMDKVESQYRTRMNTRYLPGIPGVDWAGVLGGIASAASSYATLPDNWDGLATNSTNSTGSTENN